MNDHEDKINIFQLNQIIDSWSCYSVIIYFDDTLNKTVLCLYTTLLCEIIYRIW